MTSFKDSLIAAKDLKKNTTYYLTGEYWDDTTQRSCLGYPVTLVKHLPAKEIAYGARGTGAIVKDENGRKYGVIGGLFTQYP